MRRNIECAVALAASVPLLFSISAQPISALQNSSFEVGPRVVHGAPGENAVVPFVLTSSDSIGGWSLTLEYDTSMGSVVDVQLLDSLRAFDPDGDTLRWYYAPWRGHPQWRPDYIALFLDPDGYEDRFMVMGLADMVAPPNPAVRPDTNSLLFCLDFDINPSWNGHPVVFSFLTEDCTDNTFSDETGLILWGPDTVSADPETCPQRSPDLRAIQLKEGPGVELVSGLFVRGDADSDFEVERSDAIFILKAIYLPGSPQPSCMDAADYDDNGAMEMSDAIYALKHLYVPGSPDPLPPFPYCGIDPTEDDLDCSEHPCMD
jgi:hypothetical protein